MEIGTDQSPFIIDRKVVLDRGIRPMHAPQNRSAYGERIGDFTLIDIANDENGVSRYLADVRR